MDFFIKKNSELPVLKMELIKDGRNDYQKFHEKIQNANITFTMVDTEKGIKKITCKDAEIEKKCTNCEIDDENEYYILYKWKTKDTNKIGTYKGTFNIEFLDGSGTLIAPIREELFIHIID